MRKMIWRWWNTMRTAIIVDAVCTVAIIIEVLTGHHNAGTNIFWACIILLMWALTLVAYLAEQRKKASQ